MGYLSSKEKTLLISLKKQDCYKASDNPIEVNVKLKEVSKSPLVDRGKYQ
jgi:hypothetical protein